MDRVVEALARDSRIAYALLFGSAARGHSHAGSDLDIAIGLVPGARWSAIAVATHWVADEGWAVPQSHGEVFAMLGDRGVIDRARTTRVRETLRMPA